jgi:hypothetical protein
MDCRPHDSPKFEEPEFTRAAFSGLDRHIISGAMMYVGNMGPLMALDPGTKPKGGINPLSKKNIEKTASYLVNFVVMRADQIKAEKP